MPDSNGTTAQAMEHGYGWAATVRSAHRQANRRLAFAASFASAAALAACGGGVPAAEQSDAISSAPSVGEPTAAPAPRAPVDPDLDVLRLRVSAADGGSVHVAVSSAVVAILAGASRLFVVAAGDSVTLRAAADSGHRFAGWRGACRAANSSLCEMEAAPVGDEAFAAADFALVPVTLMVTAGRGGSVAVAVGSAIGTVLAGQTQGFSFSVRSAAVLEALPAAGYRFAGWSGACAGSGAACRLPSGSVAADTSVLATFAPALRTLTVAAGRGGSVAVSIDTATAVSVAAQSAQGFNVDVERSATLEAVAADGWRFAGWVGDCAEPDGASCGFPLGALVADATASAVFSPMTYTLTVSASTGGSVRAAVSGAPAVAVDAGKDRGFVVTVEDTAILRAAPNAHYAFERWDGACDAAAGACLLASGALAGSAAVAAIFRPISYNLAVSASTGGAVAVSVSGAFAGEVAEGSSGAFAVTVESSAALRAGADAGHVFERWDGACAGAGAACELASGALAGSAAAAAIFRSITYSLAVSASTGGAVAISVSGTLAGEIAAGERSEFAVAVSQPVALEAKPAGRYGFSNWTGACATAADAACALPAGRFAAGEEVAAVAVFVAVTGTLAVSASAGGAVEVFISGAFAGEVAEGSSGAFAVTVESSATLKAVANAGYVFQRWDGECAGAAGACELASGALAGSAAAAIFRPITYKLAVWASKGGSVRISVSDALVGAVAAGERSEFAVAVSQPVALEAKPAGRYGFSSWTNACATAAGAACALPAGGFAADEKVAVAALFVPSTSAFTVSASAGGSVRAAVSGAPAVAVGAGESRGFVVTVEDTAILRAAPNAHYAFERWDGECAGAGELCVLAADALAGWATAIFRPISYNFAVSASTGGAVAVSVSGAFAGNVAEGSSGAFVATVESSATLRALASAGYAFGRWDGECAGAGELCALAAGVLAGPAATVAIFEPVPYRFTVRASAGGAVEVSVSGAFAGEVAEGAAGEFTLSAGVSATLVAVAREFHLLVRWTGACADSGEVCELATGGLGDRPAFAVAQFIGYTWTGPGLVFADGATLIAAPYAPDAFIGWLSGPCEGTSSLDCVISVTEAGGPVAAFHPFVVDGIKSLVFGLGYRHLPKSHFRVLLHHETPSVNSQVSDLGALAPGPESARLSVSVHLLPWGAGAYLTEACDAPGNCTSKAASRRALAQVDSIAATGYFKAPNAGAEDQFGWSVSLDADGRTLAVGALFEDSSAAGAHHPGEPRWDAALASAGAGNSGAAYVYRQDSSGRWAAEAFIKAPAPGAGDRFGRSVALSADGRTLAVGAVSQDSSAVGAHHPDEPRWDAALASTGERDSGAAHVYRRDSSGRWAIAAFVKAPAPGAGDRLGWSVALSADGRTLAVSAPFEGSSATGAHHPDEPRWDAALASAGAGNSGAAYVYRQDSSGHWAAEAFVKAPAPGAVDVFGWHVALSADGRTLAVSAPFEGSSVAGAHHPGDPRWDAALSSDNAFRSGAAYVYRQDSSSRWAVEAFVKAPAPDAVDLFGQSVALSADGRTLAVGAVEEDSAAAGAFAPSSTRWRTALASAGAGKSGAAYVYRRDSSGRWAVEAFVKAPAPGASDRFGQSVALSVDGATLAVGALGEDSAAAGVFVPFSTGWRTALATAGAGKSGAAHVYRRDSGGHWSVGSFVKAPAPGAGDQFGFSVALSADGQTLAVGADGESAVALARPESGLADDDSAPNGDSGAVYLY